MSFNEKWEKVKLGDIANFKNGKSINKNLRNNKFNIPVYGSNGIIDYTNQSLFDEEIIIIGRVGAYCGSLQFSDKKAWVTDNAIACIVKQNVIPKFIYYTLETVPIRKMAGGSAQPLINQSILKNINIDLPSLEEQKAISNILSSIDQKIKLNNQMNQTLEKIVQAIYKKWFIDFEPFQDEEFVESELGMIPEGWEVGKLKDILTMKNGKRPQEKQDDKDNEFDIPVVGASGIMAYTNERLYNEKIIVIGRVGTLGVIQRYNYPCWTSDNTIVIKSNFYEYVFSILNDINFKNLNRGSTQPLIAQKDIKRIKIVIPPKNILISFEDKIKSLYNKVDNNKKENQFLSQIRDILLPKLMSGEIRVESFEKERG